MSTRDDIVVYSDEKYVLGREEGLPYLKADGEKYKLTCHPYEPCLYITEENGAMTAVHNAFDPSSVLWAFSKGMTITSITGFEYDAKDFCLMVEYAAGMVNIGIDDAERVFGGREKKKHPEKAENKEKKEKPSVNGEKYHPGSGRIIENDPFYEFIEKYPDSVIDSIKALGKSAGVSIHPDTPIEKVFPYIGKVDIILVMTVRPGFGGQGYMDSSDERLRKLRKAIDDQGADTIISVDGGITKENIGHVYECGARLFVAGSSVFHAEDPAKAIDELKRCGTSS